MVTPGRGTASCVVGPSVSTPSFSDLKSVNRSFGVTLSKRGVSALYISACVAAFAIRSAVLARRQDVAGDDRRIVRAGAGAGDQHEQPCSDGDNSTHPATHSSLRLSRAPLLERKGAPYRLVSQPTSPPTGPPAILRATENVSRPRCGWPEPERDQARGDHRRGRGDGVARQ